MAKIIIAEDEAKIRMLIRDFLADEGYTVIEAEDGKQALEKFAENPDADLMILDVMMPYIDGWRVCKDVRRNSRIPIIMLTAKSEEADELESFEKGANDYIPKPFSLAVLLARVNARIGIKQAEEKIMGTIISQGDLYINLETHEAELKGKPLELTPIEYELLVLLSRNKGRVYSRQQLLTQVWGYEYYGGDRTVDTHVGRLRTKLGDYGDKYIKTIRGYGYKFDDKN